MRVRITAPGGYSNPRRGYSFDPGIEAELPDDIAVKLLNAHIAVAAPRPVEAAVVAPQENTAKRVAKPKPKARAKEEDRAGKADA